MYRYSQSFSPDLYLTHAQSHARTLSSDVVSNVTLKSLLSSTFLFIFYFTEVQYPLFVSGDEVYVCETVFSNYSIFWASSRCFQGLGFWVVRVGHRPPPPPTPQTPPPPPKKKKKKKKHTETLLERLIVVSGTGSRLLRLSTLVDTDRRGDKWNCAPNYAPSIRPTKHSLSLILCGSRPVAQSEQEFSATVRGVDA